MREEGVGREGREEERESEGEMKGWREGEWEGEGRGREGGREWGGGRERGRWTNKPLFLHTHTDGVKCLCHYCHI